MSVDSFEIVKTEQMEEQENESLVTATEKLEVEAKVEQETKSEELGESELKLEENEEAKLEEEREKIRQLSALVTSINFQPKRHKISLALPNFAKLSEQEKFDVYSQAVDVAGFKWKLLAQRGKKFDRRDWLWLGLYLSQPKHYKGPFKFDVSHCFRVLNVFPGKDIIKQGSLKFKHDQPPLGIGHSLVRIEELLAQRKGFLQLDGSVQLEVDFTIETATIDHYFVEAETKEDVEKDAMDVENEKDGN